MMFRFTWWANLQTRVDVWRRRHGLELPTTGWPGVFHQGWGWYDSLSSPAAGSLAIAVILFLVATSMYVFAAGAAVVAPHRSAPYPSIATATASATRPLPTATHLTLPTVRPPQVIIEPTSTPVTIPLLTATTRPLIEVVTATAARPVLPIPTSTRALAPATPTVRAVAAPENPRLTQTEPTRTRVPTPIPNTLVPTSTRVPPTSTAPPLPTATLIPLPSPTVVLAPPTSAVTPARGATPVTLVPAPAHATGSASP